MRFRIQSNAAKINSYGVKGWIYAERKRTRIAGQCKDKSDVNGDECTAEQKRTEQSAYI